MKTARPTRRRAPWHALAGARAGLLAGALLLVGACAQDASSALQLADEAAYARDYGRAEQILRRLELRLSAAHKELQGAATETPAQAERLALHAQVLQRLAQYNALELGNLPQALRDWTRLAHLAGDTPTAGRAWLEVADLLRNRLGEPQKALPALRRAAALLGATEAGEQASQELVTTYVALGNYPAACEEAKAALARRPAGAQAAELRLQLGQVQFLAHNYRGAANTFRQVVDAQPGRTLRAMALVEAGHALQELGEAPQALELYDAALKDHPNPLLVQDRIARVRARIYQLETHRTIMQAQGPARRR